MDAFYASVEQRDRPELRGKPVIVGGSGPRGVVSAASYEARRFGVHSAMPGAEARKRCPHGVFLRGDMAKYKRESKRIFELFRELSPSVEGISLDEAFLDLTGTERLHGPARGVGEALRRRVRAETGLTISVGIAPIKMVAKIASDLAKPDGLLEVAPQGVREFLDPLPVGRLWGVGPVAQRRLQRAGFERVGDLARGDVSILRRALGDWGLAIAKLARGEDLREVTAYREPVSMSEENTFGEDIADLEVLDAAIIAHAEAVARRLRRSGFRARTAVLKAKLGTRVAPGPRGYPLLTRRRSLPEATDDGLLLARIAKALLREAALSEPVRLIGVGVTNLVPAAEGQATLFDLEPERTRNRHLNRALDQLADRFGNDAVRRGDARVSRAGLSFQIKHGEEEEADSPDQS
jgi:DNA polymerase-4